MWISPYYCLVRLCLARRAASLVIIITLQHRISLLAVFLHYATLNHRGERPQSVDLFDFETRTPDNPFPLGLLNRTIQVQLSHTDVDKRRRLEVPGFVRKR